MLVCAQALLIAPILRLGRVLCICTSGVAKPISLVRESAKGTTAGLEEVSALVAHAGRWRRRGVIRGLPAGELRRGCTSTRACERLGRVGSARDLYVLVVSRVAVAMRVHAERRRERPLCDPCARVG